jgi:hypothetical protein
MPPLEEMDRHQDAVLWQSGATDEFGRPTAGPPVGLKVRWIQKRGEGVDSNGDAVAYDARVILDREVTVGSHMWLGSLEDWDDEGADEVMYVAGTNKVPSLNGRFYLFSVMLKRFREDLPAVEGA